MREPLSTVLHYTGSDDDRGGVMSVVHALAGEAGFACELGVNPNFVQRRKRGMRLVEFPAIAGETIDLKTFWRARTVARAARDWIGGGSGRVFHAHSRAGLLVAYWLVRWREPRVVVSVHSYGQQRWFYRWAERQLGERIYWLSPAMKRYYGLAAADGSWKQCIPGCVPSACLSNDGGVRVAAADGRLRLGGVGALVRWKGWHLIVEALGLLPQELRERVRFDHIGAAGADTEGQRYASELSELTQKNGLERVITWRGEQASSGDFLRETDCLVVASNHEPFSIAVLETLAAKVPVLAADSGGAPDLLVEGKSGWFFRTGDAASLAKGIQMLLATDALLRVAIPDELVRPFTASVIAERWAAVYARL